MLIIIRLPEVKKRTGLATSTIYKKMAQKTFPNQIPLGTKSVGWLESEIQSWIEDRISESQIAMKSTYQFGGEYANR